ncbi:hypothetical protein FJY84_03015 [Candidatus Bathyarchaeota archaeon]|nr:hypothetical protein [Candidatus Bathyarchaeota archaeon]
MNKKQHKIALMGIGTIGKELLRRIKNDKNYKIVSLGDSSGNLIKKSGFTSKEITQIINFKNTGENLKKYDHNKQVTSDIISILNDYSIDTFIDVTASMTYDTLFKALDYSNVITSNKLPFSDSSNEQYTKINEKAIEVGKLLDYGTTVGAGLKIPNLIDSIGIDEIEKFYGCLSGTMNFISQRLNENIPFSKTVYEAMKPPRNYTEPDPRIDLSGTDFKRKIIILARLFGKKINLTDINAESILQYEHEKISKDEFLKILPELDEVIAAKFKIAQKEKKVLWYLGSVNLTLNEFNLGFQKIQPDNLITKCHESDNVLTIQPKLWHKPITLIGPGAGAIETVTGLISGLKDAIKIQNSFRPLVK